jgi:hypothetical protein
MKCILFCSRPIEVGSSWLRIDLSIAEILQSTEPIMGETSTGFATAVSQTSAAKTPFLSPLFCLPAGPVRLRAITQRNGKLDADHARLVDRASRAEVAEM